MQSSEIGSPACARPALRPPYAPGRRRIRPVERRDEASRQRHLAEEALSQRLYSIVLAVHAAEMNLEGDPGRLAAILQLIRVQSAASLEDLRRLDALG